MEARFHSCDSRGLLALIELEQEDDALVHQAPSPRIDGYEITARLGEGGMGVVWRAIQLSTRRAVALKVLSSLSVTRKSLMRFEREIALAARLEHPHIARVYESGTKNGLNYYAMELVDGTHLDRHVRANKLNQTQILTLMRDICLALQFAHQRGVIHRDIKPSNILVTPEGQPRVVDFGLAKATVDDMDVSVTQEGHFAGTPAFMSPEQAKGDIDNVDTRSDVYSLGATLYLLLTGSTAHDLSGPRYQAIRRIADEEVRPPRSLNKDLDIEVEWILLKALAREPDQRYVSAQALAQDIDRYLNGEPLEASPQAKIYRFRKFVRKHRAGIGLATVIAIVLITATIVSIRQSIRATHAETNAVINLADMYTARGLDMDPIVNGFSPLWFAKAASVSGSDPRRVEANLIRVNNWLPGSWIPVAAMEFPRSASVISFSPKQSRYLLATSPPSTADQHVCVWDLAKDAKVQLPAGFEAATAAAWTTDGQLILGNAAGSVAMFSLGDGLVQRRWEARERINFVAVSNDGRLMAAGAGKTLLVSTLDRNDRGTTHEQPAAIAHVGFSPDSKLVFTGADDNQARFMSVDTDSAGRVALREAFGPVAHFLKQPDEIFPPIPPLFMDGGRVLVTIEPSLLKWRDTSTGRAYAAHEMALWSASTSPDGKWLTASGGSGNMFDISGKPLQLVSPSAASSFHPVRSLCSIADQNGNVLTYELDRAGKFVEIGLPLKFPSVRSLCFSQDGEFLAVLCSQGPTRIWRMPSTKPGEPIMPSGVTLKYDGAGSWAGFSRDGRYVIPIGMPAEEGDVHSMQVFDVLRMQPVGSRLKLDGALVVAAFSPDSRRISTATGIRGDPRQLRVWDWEAGRDVCAPIELATTPQSLAYAPDGLNIAIICTDGQFFVIDPASGRVVFTRKARNVAAPAGSGVSQRIAFSHDGRAIYTFGTAEFRAWDRQTGAERFVITTRDRWHTFAESPDGRILATGTNYGNLRLWDSTDGHALLPTLEHPSDIMCIAFSADGRTILTGGKDSQLRMWDARTGQMIRTMPVSGRLADATFTRDGRNIIASLHGTWAPILDSHTGFPLGPPVRAGGGYHQRIDLSPDGRWAAIAGIGNAALLLDLQPLFSTASRSAEEAVLWCELLSSCRIDNAQIVRLSHNEWLDRWRRYRTLYPEYWPFESSSPASNAETGISMEWLAAQYRREGKKMEAAAAYSKAVTRNKEQFGADDLRVAVTLFNWGEVLQDNRFADAELRLRESLAIYRNKAPESWHRFSIESKIGQAIASQGRLSEAEPLLISGYEGQKQWQGEKTNPSQSAMRDAINQLANLYEATGDPVQTARWKRELAAFQPTTRPSTQAIQSVEPLKSSANSEN